MEHKCRSMPPFLYHYVFAGSLVVQSKTAMDGGERGQPILIDPVWNSIEQLPQNCSTADYSNVTTKNSSRNKDRNRLKTETQRTHLSKGAESVIEAKILAVLKYTCVCKVSIQHTHSLISRCEYLQTEPS